MTEMAEFWVRVMVVSMTQTEVARMERASKDGQGYVPRNQAVIRKASP